MYAPSDRLSVAALNNFGYDELRVVKQRNNPVAPRVVRIEGLLEDADIAASGRDCSQEQAARVIDDRRAGAVRYSLREAPGVSGLAWFGPHDRFPSAPDGSSPAIRMRDVKTRTPLLEADALWHYIRSHPRQDDICLVSLPGL